MQNETAQVTGAARGIGFAIAKRFAAEGTRSLIADIDAAGAQAAATELKCTWRQVDVF